VGESRAKEVVMEAGYEYLLFRRRLQHRFFNICGVFIVVLGALMLVSSGAYYSYAAAARSSLPELDVSMPINPYIQADREGPSQPLMDTDSSVSSGNINPFTAEEEMSLSDARTAPGLLTLPGSAISARQLYPGDGLNAEAWSYPASYEPLSYIEEIQLKDFKPMVAGESFQDQPAATYISIPSIGINSSVDELDVLDLAGGRFYETPVNTVGHIPTTAHAGEPGSAWYFGHAESPISGEGSVFYNLTELPGKLQNGEDVFIVSGNDQQRFLYRVTSTRVVHQNELKLINFGRGTIHLVSCVPKLVYDHRLIIDGELVAQSDIP